MKMFISGGCKNGKSTLAQNSAYELSNGGPLYYLATMIPHDEEDKIRIQRHVSAREGMGFLTIECGCDILSCLDTVDKNGTFLLDSVTALLSNEMFHDGIVDEEAVERTLDELRHFAMGVKNAVFVSDFVFSNDRSYDEHTENYCRGLARCDRMLASICDTVVEVCIGQYTVYKGDIKGRKLWI